MFKLKPAPVALTPGLLTPNGNLTDAAWTCIRVWDAESRPVKWMARQLGVWPSTVRDALVLDMPSKRAATNPPPVSAAHRGVMKRRRERVKVLCLETVVGNHGPRRKHPAAAAIARVWNLENPLLPVSVSTVQRDLRSVGLVSRRRPRGPKRVVGDEKRRVVFAASLLRKGKKMVERIAFTDAKYYDSNCHGNTREWCVKGDQPSSMVKDTWAPRVHVWGFIAKDVKFLVRIPSHKPTAASYKRYCLIPLVKHLSKCPGGVPDVVVQHDGDTAYGTEECIRYLAGKGLESLEGWPARSPDLSPIENMWAIVSKRVDAYGPLDVEGLWGFVERAWDDIPMSTVNALVLSFHGRLKKCVAGGGRTITTKGSGGKKRAAEDGVAGGKKRDAPGK